MLTIAAAKAAGARSRPYKLADAGGLHLHVAPTGTKSWRLKYRFGGKEKLLTIGRFPAISLQEARTRREEAKAKLRAGIDPGVTQIESPETFEQLARVWYRHNLASWSPAHAADVLASLERDIFPAIGAKAAGDIDPPELLNALRSVEKRGRIETARRVRQRLAEIFAYGIAEGSVTGNPAEHLAAALRDPPPARPQPALTDIDDCRALLAACETAPARKSTVLASRFLALTAVRLDAVRGMRWDEIEWRGAETLWIVPPARMKLKKAKKDEERFAHLVPLSAAAIEVLRETAKFRNSEISKSVTADLVFPGRDDASPIGEGAIGALYARAGYAGRHVPHGWRSSFSTILNEQLGEEWAVSIDRALGHSPKDKVEAAYNRAKLLSRRRQLFDRWAEMLIP